MSPTDRPFDPRHFESLLAEAIEVYDAILKEVPDRMIVSARNQFQALHDLPHTTRDELIEGMRKIFFARIEERLEKVSRPEAQRVGDEIVAELRHASMRIDDPRSIRENWRVFQDRLPKEARTNDDQVAANTLKKIVDTTSESGDRTEAMLRIVWNYGYMAVRALSDYESPEFIARFARSQGRAPSEYAGLVREEIWST